MSNIKGKELISGKTKPMNFTNTEMKIDQIVGYLNENKIDLSPVFQRGHVWKKPLRSSLLKNILSKKPIPAIFLYKQEHGSKFSYNILDGKQRIESLILFIASSNPELKINRWESYFSDPKYRKDERFKVQLDGSSYSIDNLPDEIMRNFREYQIPTVEIIMDENTSIDEIITLFVDINQQGVDVTRFQIVKAMCKDSEILNQSFDMVALEWKAGKDPIIKLKNTAASRVIKNLSVIDNTIDKQAKVDKIWEKLTEILIFSKTGKHVKPSQILKGFINKKDFIDKTLTKSEIIKIGHVFKFIDLLYKSKQVKESPLARDQTHFYTLVTSIIAENLLTSYTQEELIKKCTAFSKALSSKSTHKTSIQKDIKDYLDLSKRSTADADNRSKRQALFVSLIKSI